MLNSKNIIMRKINILFILIVLFLLVLCCRKIFAWEKAKEKNGITIYTRKIEGSDFKEFKAVMCVKTSLAGLVALFEDIESHPRRAGRKAHLNQVGADGEMLPGHGLPRHSGSDRSGDIGEESRRWAQHQLFAGYSA